MKPWTAEEREQLRRRARQLRAEGLTLTVIATRLGISVSSVNHLLRGEA